MNFNSSLVLAVMLIFPIAIFAQSDESPENHTVSKTIYFSNYYSIEPGDKGSIRRECQWDTINYRFNGRFKDISLENNFPIAEGEYVDGLKEGMFSHYDSGVLILESHYKNDSMVGIWTFYNSKTALKSFDIDFSNNDFKIVNIYNKKGNIEKKKKHKFEFEFLLFGPNQSIAKLKGRLKNGFKDGEWKIEYEGNKFASDSYNKGDLESSSIDMPGRMELDDQGRAVSPKIFEPYMIHASEEFRNKARALKSNYHLLEHIFEFQEIPSSIGLIGDSIIFKMDQKPKFFGGQEMMNKSLETSVEMDRSGIVECLEDGYIYFDLMIDEKGNVDDVVILKSPCDYASQRTILRAQKLAPFIPGYHKGVPIGSKITTRQKASFLRSTRLGEPKIMHRVYHRKPGSIKAR